VERFRGDLIARVELLHPPDELDLLAAWARKCCEPRTNPLRGRRLYGFSRGLYSARAETKRFLCRSPCPSTPVLSL